MTMIGKYPPASSDCSTALPNTMCQAGYPWSVSKGYDGFCPISNEIPKIKIPNPDNTEIYLNVNGKQRQRGNTNGMIFNTSTIISYISHIFTLEPGDVILSGR